MSYLAKLKEKTLPPQKTEDELIKDVPDTPYHVHLDNTKKKLDEISPSFCAAKWQQVTLHLQNGHTHSCHHPTPHHIPLEEIAVDISALHNTKFKKQQRKMMLEGQRPPECSYCWKVEDSSTTVHSDRIIKSADVSWAYRHIDKIKQQPWDQNVDPSYLEVSFGNVCNFKCSYCAPQYSSQWMEEIERYGPYPTTGHYNNIEWLKRDNLMPIPNNQDNPYVDAFWEWFPTIYSKLAHFRITGGEPLLNKNTFLVLDYIIQNPNPALDFSINSNLNPTSALWKKFLEKIDIIIKEKKVRNFKVFTSAEAHGRQAEYIRFGMNYEQWLKNFTEALDLGIQFTVMSTYNALSVTTYKEFLQDMVDLKHRVYKKEEAGHMCRLLVDIPYLRQPVHQSVFILPPKFQEHLYDQLTFMYRNMENTKWADSSGYGFFEFEIEKLKRVYNFVQSNPEIPSDLTARKDFKLFVNEHDRRRGTNFKETFPDLVEFYESIPE